MQSGFLEVVFPLREGFGLDERDAFEDWLHVALAVQGLGAVIGAGVGPGTAMLDINVPDAEQTEQVVAFLLDLLRSAGAPAGTFLRLHRPHKARVNLNRL